MQYGNIPHAFHVQRVLTSLTMKPICYTLFLMVTLMAASSCSKDNDEPEPDIPQSEVFIKKQTLTLQGGGGGHGGHGDTLGYFHSGSIDFTYDTLGRLKTAGNIIFIYSPEGKLIMTASGPDTIRYHYNNGRLEMVTTNCGYYDGGRFTDTITLYYDGEKVRSLTSSHMQLMAEFAYNGQGYISTRILHITAPGSVVTDSLFYTWEKGNLVKLETRPGYPYVNFSYIREFRYDDKPCFTRAIHYPPEYLYIREITQFFGMHPMFYYEVIPWRFNCKNNPVSFSESTIEQQRTVDYEVMYNETGYPSMIHGDVFTLSLEYY